MTRTCIDCKESKSSERFYRRSDRPSGKASVCKECDAIRSAKRRYGLSQNEAKEAVTAQVCDLCGSNDNRRLSVDHCHETGKIRGFLCSNCNLGLGHFKDSIRLLQSAAAYLARH